jgi:hypothetical protein
MGKGEQMAQACAMACSGKSSWQVLQIQRKVWRWKPLHDMHMHSEQLNCRNLAARRWTVVLLVLNFIGAVVYVVAGSNGWVIPQERELGLHSVTGEPYVWALFVFPIWAVFFMLDLTWGVFIVARKQWRSGTFLLFTIPIWLIAVAIDFAHH